MPKNPHTHTAPAGASRAAVDVGVTLGELDGHTVVVAAFATAGITSQLQLPAESAAQVGLAMLTGAQAAGVDVAKLLASWAGDAAPALVMPGLGDTARINSHRDPAGRRTCDG